jgi:hypothetical protein
MRSVGVNSLATAQQRSLVHASACVKSWIRIVLLPLWHNQNTD